jgi:hypothetical protein
MHEGRPALPDGPSGRAQSVALSYFFLAVFFLDDFFFAGIHFTSPQVG